jgi:16S rRNA (uracil1498-N3)-methyltransferase
MPRIYCSTALAAGNRLDLPAGAARHVQVLRLQPGNALTLFDGFGGEYAATVQRMGRSDVVADIGQHDPIEREAVRAIHLAVGLIASDRMDWFVEKATELGAASVQPLAAERSVLRLAADRAAKKETHWRNVAIAACEQCGRNRLPLVHPVRTVASWLQALRLPVMDHDEDSSADPAAAQGDGAAGQASSERLVLSFAADSERLQRPLEGVTPDMILLSGPEGGLTPQEEALALRHGFRPTSLGSRTLRAETAPLAALARLG